MGFYSSLRRRHSARPTQTSRVRVTMPERGSVDALHTHRPAPASSCSRSDRVERPADDAPEASRVGSRHLNQLTRRRHDPRPELERVGRGPTYPERVCPYECVRHPQDRGRGARPAQVAHRNTPNHDPVSRRDRVTERPRRVDGYDVPSKELIHVKESQGSSLHALACLSWARLAGTAAWRSRGVLTGGATPSSGIA